MASSRVEECIDCMGGSRVFAKSGYFVRKSPNSLSDHRLQFLQESLIGLDSSLRTLGQQLDVIYAPALETIAQLITRHDIGAIYGTSSADYGVNEVWKLLRDRYPLITFSQISSGSLISSLQLPFPVDELPDSFSKFRRKVEPIEISEPLIAPDSLPRRPANATASEWLLNPITTSEFFGRH